MKNDPLTALEELILYTKHWPDCDQSEIACPCGLSQLRVKGHQELQRVRTLIENIQALAVSLHRNGNDHLMDYDGDNHGDTAEAAHNRCSECCAAELDKLLVDLGVKP